MNAVMLEWFLAGGGLVAVGVLIGRHAPTRRKGRDEPKQVKAVCGCTHELAYHDPKTSECHGLHQAPSKYDRFGDVAAYEHIKCPCKQYDGPRPLESFYAPEITSD